MAGKITVRDNSDEVISFFEKAKHRALERIGLAAEGYAKKALTEQGAVDTGLLRNSVTYAISGYQTHVQDYRRGNVAGGATEKHARYAYSNEAMEGDKDEAVYIGSNVEYAIFIENGARGQSPRPFLKPAATEHGTVYKRILEDELKG